MRKTDEIKKISITMDADDYKENQKQRYLMEFSRDMQNYAKVMWELNIPMLICKVDEASNNEARIICEGNAIITKKNIEKMIGDMQDFRVSHRKEKWMIKINNKVVR